MERFQELVGARGKAGRDAWFELYDRYKVEYPELAEELLCMQRRELPEGLGCRPRRVPRG